MDESLLQELLVIDDIQRGLKSLRFKKFRKLKRFILEDYNCGGKYRAILDNYYSKYINEHLYEDYPKENVVPFYVISKYIEDLLLIRKGGN